jgi:hypothetical protein
MQALTEFVLIKKMQPPLMEEGCIFFGYFTAKIFETTINQTLLATVFISRFFKS